MTETLPPNVVREICSNLDITDVKNMMSVSTLFRVLCLESLNKENMAHMSDNIKFVSFAYHVANVFYNTEKEFKLFPWVDFMLMAGNNEMIFYFDNGSKSLHLFTTIGKNEVESKVLYEGGGAKEKFISTFVDFMLKAFPLQETRSLLKNGITNGITNGRLTTIYKTSFVLYVENHTNVHFVKLLGNVSEPSNQRAPQVFNSIQRVSQVSQPLSIPQSSLQPANTITSTPEFKYVNQSQLELLLKDEEFNIATFCQILYNINESSIDINKIIDIKNPSNTGYYKGFLKRILEASTNPQPGGSRVDFKKMTLNDLKEFSRSKKFAGYSRLNKSEMIKFLVKMKALKG